MSRPVDSLADAPSSARVARLLASPAGVLVMLPLLVVGVGIAVLLIGRNATREASVSMARRQLAAQAADVRHDVAFALDQAAPLLANLRDLADPDRPIAEVAVQLRALQLGRPGITNLSIGFPSGLMRGTFRDRGTTDDEVYVQESRIGEAATHRVNYRVAPKELVVRGEETTDYDVRTRPHYVAAAKVGHAIWLPPRTYFTSKTTGITCAAPVLVGGVLVAVVTVDFDVGALSEFIAKTPLVGARTVVFAKDGTILAVPGTPVPPAAAAEDRLLRAPDYHDEAITNLFADLPKLPPESMTGMVRFAEVDTADGPYLASVAPIGGTRAGVATSLDWYLATLVPEHTLIGPTKRFQRQTLVASGAALAAALAIAMLFAWNLVRMRRAMTTARAQLRTAEARAKQLGSYRLVSKLGSGGMGEVWRAEHRMLARQAAIKLVRPETMRDPLRAMKMRERFRREAQTLAAMRSRNTIALHDYGMTDDGTFYFVMELLDGLDLDRLIKEFGAVPAARAIHLLAQACGSLAEAHDAGLLHRDIKPANLFISRAADEVDVVKVLDFGIVQSLHEPSVDPAEMIAIQRPEVSMSGRLTSVDAVVGTIGYIAPECAFGTEVDARADLYALGCVAWWLLTGGEVFARGTEHATLDAHANQDVPPLRDRVKGWLPTELEQLVMACLAKRPQERPASARALAESLRAIAIPDDHAWIGERANAWWFVHRPAKAPADAAVAPAKETTVERFVVNDPTDVEIIVESVETVQAKRGSR